MTTEISAPDLELEELMKQLEEETGVSIPTSPAPVTATAAPVTATAAPVTATAAPVGESDDELLASLEVAPAAAAATVAIVEEPVIDNSALLAELEGSAVASEPQVQASPEDELAALEAELSGSGATATAVTEEPLSRPTVSVVAVKELPIVNVVSSDKREEERGVEVLPGQGVVSDPAEAKPEPESPQFNGRPDPMGGELNFFTDPKKFHFETAISDVDLDRCFVEQNSLRAYYGTEAARAEQQAARVKVKFEVIEAALYERHRRLAAEDGEKVTEKALEGRVKTDPRWLSGKMKVIDAAAISDINRALVESLKDRKDMLVQMGADRRGEMQGQARMSAGSAYAQDMRERASNETLKEQMAVNGVIGG